MKTFIAWIILKAVELSASNMADIGNARSIEASVAKQKDALAAVAVSLEKQRGSVRRQVQVSEEADGSFFTIPWPRPVLGQSTAIREPECERMPLAELTPLMEEAARREELRPDLLRAVIQQESFFRPCATSSKGALGLMQLMPATIEQFGIRNPFDPKENIDGGAKFLKQLLTRYEGDLALALGAYNAGPGKVDAARGVPPFPETLNYVNTIIENLQSR